MSATSELHRCSQCGALGVRLDEADTCEQCVHERECLAGTLQEQLEGVIDDLRKHGLSDDGIRAAVEMILRDAFGPLDHTYLERTPSESGAEWLGPHSLWMEEQDPSTNLHSMRRCMLGYSLEAYADRLGVSPQALALWEQGVLPPRDVALRMVRMGGLALDYIVDAAPRGLDGCYCNRCGEDAPGNPYRFEQGWDVANDGAGGVELVCPDCLKPGDLIWPSDDQASEGR